MRIETGSVGEATYPCELSMFAHTDYPSSRSTSDPQIHKMPVGCPAPDYIGCACTGQCQDTIEVVDLAAYRQLELELAETHGRLRFAEQLLADVLREARETRT
jgi:hypothetical protein